MRDDMRNDTRRDVRHDTADAGLARLGELDDFQVADGDPDIRGWDVKTPDGRKVGKVEELIVDTAAMRVRYMEVKADKKALGTDDDRSVLVPIGAARLDEDEDDVLIDHLPKGGLAAVPPYARGRLTPDYERSLRDTYGQGAAVGGTGSARDAHGHDLYDDRRFWGNRRRGREGTAYLTRSEEELAVGKRRAKAGEVEVRKTVETKHVQEKVPVTREEVTVERRPASGRHTKPRIGEDEITVPVMEEEVVVEKRAVPKEEVVIRKETRRDEKTVEADLRKERIDVDKRGDVDARNR